MPDLEYASEDLRAGARHADRAHTSATGAATRLRGIGGGAPYGDVAGSPVLHAAVGRAHSLHHQVIDSAASALAERAGQIRRAAQLGDDNTAETTWAAASASAPGTTVSGGQ